MSPFPSSPSASWQERVSLRASPHRLSTPVTLPSGRGESSQHPARTDRHCSVSIMFVFTITTIKVICNSFIFKGATEACLFFEDKCIFTLKSIKKEYEVNCQVDGSSSKRGELTAPHPSWLRVGWRDRGRCDQPRMWPWGLGPATTCSVQACAPAWAGVGGFGAVVQAEGRWSRTRLVFASKLWSRSLSWGRLLIPLRPPGERLILSL